MQTISTDPARLGSTTNRREHWREYSDLVLSVAETYERIRNLPAVVAFNPDPNPESQSHKWTPLSCDFQIDVEHALAAAIRNNSALLGAWNNLLDNPDVIGPNEQRLIQRAGPVFAERGLWPRQYFTIIRRKIGERIR